MKKKTLLMMALLTLTAVTSAQKNLEKTFDKVAKTGGIEVSTDRSIERDDDGTLRQQTSIVNFRVGPSDHKLLKELQEAFDAEAETATMAYTCFSAMKGISRPVYEVSHIRIGSKPSSSYAICTFADRDNPGYRTAYAAEWWDTGDGQRQGMLVRSYGVKPEKKKASVVSVFNPSDYLQRLPALGDSTAIDGLLKERFNIPDIDTKRIIDQTNSILQQLQQFTDTAATAIPFDGDTKVWLRKAINSTGRLNAAEWHRVFALMALQIEGMAGEHDRQRSKADCTVAAGIVLDLCKNAPQLDDDERELCVGRLKQLAASFAADNQYVGELLLLAAKKLQKDKSMGAVRQGFRTVTALRLSSHTDC